MQVGSTVGRAIRATRTSVLENSSGLNLSRQACPLVSHRERNHHSWSHQSRSRKDRHRNRSNPGTVLSFSLLPALYTLVPDFLKGDGPNPDLSPYSYTRHTIHSIQKLGPQHIILRIELNDKSRAMFDVDRDGDGDGDGEGHEVTIQHVCVKSPDLQIERPYTPINDPAKDGYMELVVKRVRGGEVGRYIHSMQAGDEIELRGPITTTKIPLRGLSEVDLISTGTGIAPFMQLLNKLNSRSTSNSTSGPNSSTAFPVATLKRELPTFNLYQCEPREGALDLAEVGQFFPALRKANGDITVEGSGGAGPRIRFVRYKAGGDGKTGEEWEKILLPKPEGQSAFDVMTESEGQSSWWSTLWKTTPDAEETVTSASDGNVSKVDPTRGAIMCLPKAMADSLVGRDYPLTLRRGDLPLGGILGRLGYRKDRVWVL